MSSQNSKGILLESGTNEVEFLQIGIGRQHYGINVGKIRQILSFQPSMLTDIPGDPGPIRGLFYFRDKPAPVIDLTEYMKVKGVEVTEDGKDLRRLLVVTEINKHTVGMIIDQVYGILRISWTQFDPIEVDMFSQNHVNVVGTVKMQDHVIMVLDVESLLADLIPSAALDADLPKIDATSHPTRKNISIVYCEDSAVVQKVLTATLRKAGFDKIKVFNNGEEGMKYLTSETAENVDIVLSDIEMPRMDGLTFCRELRKVQKYNKIPLIFFSSMISDEMKEKCKSVGGNAAYSKPDVVNIIKEIDNLLDIQEQP